MTMTTAVKIIQNRTYKQIELRWPSLFGMLHREKAVTDITEFYALYQFTKAVHHTDCLLFLLYIQLKPHHGILVIAPSTDRLSTAPFFAPRQRGHQHSDELQHQQGCSTDAEI